MGPPGTVRAGRYAPPPGGAIAGEGNAPLAASYDGRMNEGKPDLHTLRPTERFSDRAADYARHRPTYPAAAIDAILEGLGEPSRLVAADLGAGTGISARLLADRGVFVHAVEPNAAMRAAAEPHPRIRWVDAKAEATTLPKGSVHAVVCAQSFHWFVPGAALAEIHRILERKGRVSLLWNLPDESDPFTAAVYKAIRAASSADPASVAHVRPEALHASPLFRNVRLVESGHVQRLDRDGLFGRISSASYVPKTGPLRVVLDAEIRRLFDLNVDPTGRVSLHYATLNHLADPV
jgi:SAM-dependent methyltransferase